MGTKPPAAVDERIFKDGRHDSDAAVPHTTTTSSLQGRAGCSAFTPKLVESVVGSGSTRRAEKQSPRIACTAVAAPSVRLRVLVSPCLSASMARRGCRAPCYRRVTFLSMFFLSSEISCSIDRNSCPFYRIFLHKVDKYPPAWAGQTQVLLSGGRGHCPRGLPRSPSVA